MGLEKRTLSLCESMSFNVYYCPGHHLVSCPTYLKTDLVNSAALTLYRKRNMGHRELKHPSKVTELVTPRPGTS